MKKCLLLISIAALAFSGCKKEQQNASSNIPSAENSTQTESVKSTPAQPTLTTVPGVMLWDPNGSLWLEGDDGVMTWGKVDLQFGTQIEIVCDAAKNPEIKTAKRKSGGKIEDREFVRVKYDGKDNYWAQTALVSVNAKPAIVIENDTLIYNNPSLTSMTSTKIPFGKIVAVSQEGDYSPFVKIDAKLAPNYIDIRGKYIKWEKIVSDEVDVQALQMLELAKAAKSDEVRNELLKNAKTLTPSTIVANLIAEYEAELNTELTAAGIETEKTYTEKTLSDIVYIRSENGDTINVRETPATGKVVAKVQDGDAFMVVGETNETDVIDGKESTWLHGYVGKKGENDENGGQIFTSTEGWIFGGYTAH